MIPANQHQLRQLWPTITDDPPILLDWLPWSHTFGGNHNVNMVLVNGGTLWIDTGRPTTDLIHATINNLLDVSPTIYFNVPAGYNFLVPILERNPQAAKAFFAHLRIAFFAAAAKPQQLDLGTAIWYHLAVMKVGFAATFCQLWPNARNQSYRRCVAATGSVQGGAGRRHPTRFADGLVGPSGQGPTARPWDGSVGVLFVGLDVVTSIAAMLARVVDADASRHRNPEAVASHKVGVGTEYTGK